MIRDEIKAAAKNAPFNGYILSGNGEVNIIKARYNISDYYFVEILEDLKKNEEIREYHVEYDKKTGRIKSYKFR